MWLSLYINLNKPSRFLLFPLELKNASTLKIRYTAKYNNLICDLSASSDDASSVINDVVNAASEKTECIQNGTCKVSIVEITNCTGHSREKRELTNVKAGFNIEYECDSKICKI